jgi:AcrR family transcriptional regulator
MSVSKSKNRSVDTQSPAPTKGDASRTTILHAAAKLATTRGLEGLSIGELADAVGMSKSGLYAHFKSKEELELATIDMAVEIFTREVLQPALAAPAGILRLRALVDAFLEHLKRQIFPGGCFFASVGMELDTRPGPARDRIAEVLKTWLGLMTQCLDDARSAGDIDAHADVPQAVFEIEAMLLAANFLFIMTGDRKALSQARTGAENVLTRLGLRTGRKSNERR